MFSVGKSLPKNKILPNKEEETIVVCYTTDRAMNSDWGINEDITEVREVHLS